MNKRGILKIFYAAMTLLALAVTVFGGIAQMDR